MSAWLCTVADAPQMQERRTTQGCRKQQAQVANIKCTLCKSELLDFVLIAPHTVQLVGGLLLLRIQHCSAPPDLFLSRFSMEPLQERPLYFAILLLLPSAAHRAPPAPPSGPLPLFCINLRIISHMLQQEIPCTSLRCSSRADFPAAHLESPAPSGWLLIVTRECKWHYVKFRFSI